MKILLDECVPKRLGKYLSAHNVSTVQGCGWAGIKNGELLKKAQLQFDVLITTDRNLSFQQNLNTLPIPVIVIHANSNRLNVLVEAVPEILRLTDQDLALEVFHIEVLTPP